MKVDAVILCADALAAEYAQEFPELWLNCQVPVAAQAPYSAQAWAEFATGQKAEIHGIVGSRTSTGAEWKSTDLKLTRFWWDELSGEVGLIGLPVVTQPCFQLRGWACGWKNNGTPDTWPTKLKSTLPLPSICSPEHHPTGDCSWVYARKPSPEKLKASMIASMEYIGTHIQALREAVRVLTSHSVPNVLVVYTPILDYVGHRFAGWQQSIIRETYGMVAQFARWLWTRFKPSLCIVLSDHGMKAVPQAAALGANMAPNSFPSQVYSLIKYRRGRWRLIAGEHTAPSVGVLCANKGPLPTKVPVPLRLVGRHIVSQLRRIANAGQAS